MAKKEVTVSQEFIDNLNARIESLEKKLAEKDEKEDKDTIGKIADSISDSTEKTLKESGWALSSMTDAFVEAVNETADALSSLSEETDTEKLGRIPGSMVSVFRKGLDIQKKALEKFEESYEKNKDD